MTTFVLVHGAFHGGWCWRDVAALLRAAGHGVLTPTQTGLGERAHLLSPDITLTTFADDVVGVLEAEEVEGAVLVGHSFGGNAITGAADRVPGRLAQLVYLDAMIPESGRSPFDGLPAEIVAQRRASAIGGLALPPPVPSMFGVPDGPGADWVRRRMTPHPLRTFETALTLANPVGNGLPCTYLVATDPPYAPLVRHAERARTMPGWTVRDLPGSHDAMVTHPQALADTLLEIAR